MADVGTVTGPDYGANQARIVVYHNFEAASQLQKVSWLTEHCAGYLLPPSLWVRVCLLIVIDDQGRDKKGKRERGGGLNIYAHPHTHTHIFYNLCLV
jgi:hypothetical protein